MVSELREFETCDFKFATGGGSLINEHLSWITLNYSLPFQVPPVTEAENNNVEDTENLMQEKRDVEIPVE